MPEKRRASEAWIFLLLLVPALIVALFTPASVLSSFPILEKFTSIFRDISPAIDRLAGVSSFPQVTKLVLSVEWTLVPAQVALFYLRLNPSFDLDNFRARRAYLTVVMFLLLGTFVWSTVMLFDVTPADLKGGMYGETLLRLACTSRLGLAVVTSLSISVTALLLAIFCIWVRHIRDIYFDHWGRNY
jgi:hypothetical protein